MGLKEWFKGLWTVEVEEEEPAFEETEAKAVEELEAIYSESVSADIASALEDLEDEEETPLEVSEAVEVSPHIDSGEASADDLLEEEDLVSHYDADVADAIDIASADAHLVSAAIEGDISAVVEEE